MNRAQQLNIRNILFEVITANWPKDPYKIKPQQMYQAQCVLDKASEQFTTSVRDQCTISQMMDHVYQISVFKILTHRFMDKMQQHRTLDLLKSTA